MTTLTFLTPPPGLAPLVEFELHRIEGADGLFALQSCDEPGIRMFVLNAAQYFPDYDPAISQDYADELEAGPAGVDVLVVANPGAEGTTVNLMAPIVVNVENRRCAQIVLENSQWPLRAELTHAA